MTAYLVEKRNSKTFYVNADSPKEAAEIAKGLNSGFVTDPYIEEIRVQQTELDKSQFTFVD
jgi:hypothetical protein